MPNRETKTARLARIHATKDNSKRRQPLKSYAHHAIKKQAPGRKTFKRKNWPKEIQLRKEAINIVLRLLKGGDIRGAQVTFLKWLQARMDLDSTIAWTDIIQQELEWLKSELPPVTDVKW